MMLQERFNEKIVPSLMEELGYGNIMQVPKIEKVVLNVGISETDNPKVIEGVVRDISLISGQRPIVTRAKRSISDFHITKGDPIGCKVTLRRASAYVFLEKLFNLVLPKTRDFRGLSSASFDGRGNYSLGLDEQLAFPEIKYDEIETIHGMDIIIVTTAKSDREGYYLLKELGLPFKD